MNNQNDLATKIENCIAEIHCKSRTCRPHDDTILDYAKKYGLKFETVKKILLPY